MFLRNRSLLKIQGILLSCAILSFIASTLAVAADPVQSAETTHKAAGVQWSSWNDAAFQRAKKEGKPLILDLEAVWCHWCHVMDDKTYSNPTVAKLLNSKFVPLRVDQDSRPDLSVRYQDYGWPATIVFSPAGKEIEKRAGFISPQDMISLLQNVIKDPNRPRRSASAAGATSYSSKAALPSQLKSELLAQCVAGYDSEHGGWGSGHKFLDWDTVEYCLSRAREKNSKFFRMAKSTLDGELHLVDPVWGGVYQYSTDGDWVHPHFEKIMQMQGEDMRLFCLAYEASHDPKYLQAARDIEKFLSTFLTSSDGAFYTSMDADLVPGKHSGDYFKAGDEERRKQGIPRIDKHIYARENGWAINGLVALYSATSEQKYLDQATTAAKWVLSNRALPDGGFRHDATDSAGPYLDDTLSMGRAFLALYGATGERDWLAHARKAADFIDKHFKLVHAAGKAAGYATSDVIGKLGPSVEPNVDENVMVARFMNLLNQYTGAASYKSMAETAMRFLATPDIARRCGMYTAGILLSDDEVGSAPAHVTVVGAKDDPQAKLLLQSALQYPSGYKVVEWWDRREGPLPHMDIEFPKLEKAAAFACAFERCSAPVYDPTKLNATIDSLAIKQ